MFVSFFTMLWIPYCLFLSRTLHSLIFFISHNRYIFSPCVSPYLIIVIAYVCVFFSHIISIHIYLILHLDMLHSSSIPFLTFCIHLTIYLILHVSTTYLQYLISESCNCSSASHTFDPVPCDVSNSSSPSSLEWIWPHFRTIGHSGSWDIAFSLIPAHYLLYAIFEFRKFSHTPNTLSPLPCDMSHYPSPLS